MNSSLCVTRLSFTRSRFDLIKGVNFNVKVFFQLFRRGKVNISNSLIGYLIHISWQEPWAFHLCACYLSVDACPAFDVYYGAGAMQAWFGKPSLATWTVSRNYFTFGLSYNPNVDEWVAATTYFLEIIFPLTEATNPDTTWLYASRLLQFLNWSFV